MKASQINEYDSVIKTFEFVQVYVDIFLRSSFYCNLEPCEFFTCFVAVQSYEPK